jgi:hypothetical protein
METIVTGNLPDIRISVSVGGDNAIGETAVCTGGLTSVRVENLASIVFHQSVDLVRKNTTAYLSSALQIFWGIYLCV